MALQVSATQQKLAEKLTILNDRGIGMLTRIYNIKKMLGDPHLKPSFLIDKNMESVIKMIVRKFPHVDSKPNSKEAAQLIGMKNEIIKSLSLYYYTFVDILDFKDHVTNLLTTIDACQVTFDLMVNFDLTKSYLDLIVTYVNVLLVLSRIDDRKAVLGLFNYAFDIANTKSESSFPRLGTMIVEYENVIKRLAEEFIPHSKSLMQAVISMKVIYPRRCNSAEQWRKSQLLSLLSNSRNILQPVQTDWMHCEYISLDRLERWIAFSLLLCHQQMETSKDAQLLWRHVCVNNFVITICRDEVLHFQNYVSTYFETIKGYSKRVSDLKETHAWALANTPKLHADKRKYLRTALRELVTVFTDKPGLMGPKALYIFMALSYTRDEIYWMLRHHQNPPRKIQQGNSSHLKAYRESLTDKALPEMLFLFEELRSLVRTYHNVLEIYHVKFLRGADAHELEKHTKCLTTLCPEEETTIISSIQHRINSLQDCSRDPNCDESFDFKDLRLDWFRFQAYCSIQRAPFQLLQYTKFAETLNTICFHTLMVDSIDEMIVQCSDLSIYFFYETVMEEQFAASLSYRNQFRYSIAFPMVCADWLDANHPLCPEERKPIALGSIQLAKSFIDKIVQETINMVFKMCHEHCKLAQQLLPKECAIQISNNVAKPRHSKSKKDKDVKEVMPGEESCRRNRALFTDRDRYYMALCDLCYTINHRNIIHIWNKGIVPREIFTTQLEHELNAHLVNLMDHNPETGEIAKPSELLSNIKAIMSFLQSLENHIDVDMSRVFNNILPQQTQNEDSLTGSKTITFIYTQWYLEVLLRKVSAGDIVFSPTHLAFISLPSENTLSFDAQDYADIIELRALAELIGPYGMRHLSDVLMWHVLKQIEELKIIVVRNKDLLFELRTNFDKSDAMRDLQRKLPTTDTDNLLNRLTIVGVLLAFRDLAQSALHDVLELRIPFLLSTIDDFQRTTNNMTPGVMKPHLDSNPMIVNDMSSAAGLKCHVDPVLYHTLQRNRQDTSSTIKATEYQISCLLMVYAAVALPRFAKNENSMFLVKYQAHANNIHCLAGAINYLSAALFTLHGPGDVCERLTEFLALASSSLLRLGQETDRDITKNRDSIYLLLDSIVKQSPPGTLTMDQLESCFPYALLRTSYKHVSTLPDPTNA